MNPLIRLEDLCHCYYISAIYLRILRLCLLTGLGICAVIMFVLLPPVIVSLSYIGDLLAIVYLVLMLKCESLNTSTSNLDCEPQQPIGLIKLTCVIYQTSWVANSLITAVFWGYLFPFWIVPNLNHPLFSFTFQLVFTLSHIFPFVMHLCEFCFNNIRICFLRAVYPSLFISAYGILCIFISIVSPGLGYPMLQASDPIIILVFLFSCALIIVISQFIATFVTRHNTFSFSFSLY